MRMRTLAATAAFVLASAGGAMAFDEAPYRAELKRHCTGDYLSLCSEHSPGGPEVQACFKKNKARLSRDCSAAITVFQKAKARG